MLALNNYEKLQSNTNKADDKTPSLVATPLKDNKRKKPAIRNESRAFKKDPAATYSPTQKVMQYHRR